MDESQRSTLEVVGDYEEDLTAHQVDVFVSIHGSSTFTGRAALSKAKEVSSLVQALVQLGIPESSIDLESVRAEVRSGFLGKSSSAFYQLRVRVEDLERLPGVLGAVAAATQASLDRLTWRYPDDEATEARLLARATQRAMEKCKAIAQALDVPLLGVHCAQELRQHEPQEYMVTLGGAPGAMRARGVSEEADLGVAIQHRRKTRREVRLVCSIAKR
ncbi:MAG: SIMPL domain-containing protein [Myxococcales bacterium]